MSHEPLNEPVASEWKRTVDQLTRLRDEIRVQIHLAGMDLQREFVAAESELETLALSTVAATDERRLAALERLRALEDVMTRVARSIPGGP